MTFWDFADKHPVIALSFVFLFTAAACFFKPVVVKRIRVNGGGATYNE